MNPVDQALSDIFGIAQAHANTVRAVAHADRQYIQAATDRIAELERENSKLRANASYYEKLYRELVPAQCFAWIDRDDVPTDEGLFHETLIKFFEKNAEVFDDMLAKAHLEWVEIEKAEAKIAAKGEF